MRFALAAAAAAGALSGCSAAVANEPQTFPAPAGVANATVCDEWMKLDTDIRTAYAMHRLAEMRANDGLDPGTAPPTDDQAALLRNAMEAQCGQDTMSVAAIWRVAHDQYTRLHAGGILLD